MVISDLLLKYEDVLLHIKRIGSYLEDISKNPSVKHEVERKIFSLLNKTTSEYFSFMKAIVSFFNEER